MSNVKCPLGDVRRRLRSRAEQERSKAASKRERAKLVSTSECEQVLAPVPYASVDPSGRPITRRSLKV